jgi:predicted nucleic acid-binding protein
MMERRILLDTNIYGRLIDDDAFLEYLSSLVPKTFVIYGSSLIRKELRDVSKNARKDGKSMRSAILSIYDYLVRKNHHSLEVNEFILLLSHKYVEAYRDYKGGCSLNEMFSDLQIVASATLYKLDVVVSDDKRTMLGTKAKKAYEKINKNYNFRTPKFYTYNSFKQLARRCH